MSDDALDRTPPFADEAEVGVLCAMMISKDAVPVVLEVLRPEDFYRDAHRRVYRGAVSLWERGEEIDVITLAERLRSSSELDSVGGLDYLSELVGAIPHAAHAEYHAKLVREKAVLRRLIEASSETIRDAYDVGDRTVSEILSTAEARVMGIETGGGNGPVRAKNSLWDTMERIERLQEAGKDEVPGIPSGLVDLDRFTLGLRPGQLTVIAARPSMGKTSLAMTWALHAALSESVPTVVFSLEMTRDELLTRALAMEGRVDMQALIGGRKMTPEENQRIAQASGHLNVAPLFIDDDPEGSLRAIESKARRIRKSEDARLFVVDYLQLMTADGDDRRRELETITARLKKLARSLGVPVVLLSQLSRGPENRTNKRPMLSDLRDTGAIEQDADRVIMIFRPEYYMSDEEKKRDLGKIDGLAELIIPKQRNGPTGTVKAYFRKAATRFESLAEDDDLRW